MDAASCSGVLSRAKLPVSNLHKFNQTLGSHIVSVSCQSSEGLNNVNRVSSQALAYTVRESYLCGPVQRRNPAGICAAGVATYGENAVEYESHAQAAEDKVGVLLLNLGGPDTLHDVQPFLFNLFADPDIIRLPRLFRFLQWPLAKLISVVRAPKSKEGYAAIGGGSPLRKITDEQIKRDRITRLVVLPLYPQFSISTTGSSIRVLQNIFREDAYLSRLPVSIIRSWYQREGYVNSMADLIQKELGKFQKPEEVMIFFSAHGVPVSYVEKAGDPYRDQMEECIYLIMQRLKDRGINNDHTLAYQSRVGPVKWLKPYTDEVLVELGQKGVKSLLAIPVSFVSEHIETLEEIDMEYKELALESGIENWGRVPALNCTPSFITDLADAVIEALPSALAMSAPKNISQEDDHNPVRYAIKMFFGSILAFVLFFSPRMINAFRNQLF
ncbi:Ferrochelatase-1 [Citrus sinensis]|uniref:Ferrochelatase-1 n=1 Tax=Citrus sinensis TaxID=2711 RepID=A0ACB8NPU9_CITSI|nr:Ferrochelatase-1 [Citrus sinensis]